MDRYGVTAHNIKAVREQARFVLEEQQLGKAAGDCEERYEDETRMATAEYLMQQTECFGGPFWLWGACNLQNEAFTREKYDQISIRYHDCIGSIVYG